MSMEFIQFKPMNLKPMMYEDTKAVETIKKFLQNLVSQSKSELKLDNFSQWLETFNTKVISKPAMDELVQLAEIAEDKNKIAVFDCMRLLILNPDCAEYIVGHHWELIELLVIGYMASQDLKNKEDKIIHNYHLGCLKMLANIYNTDAGKHAITVKDKSLQLI